MKDKKQPFEKREQALWNYVSHLSKANLAEANAGVAEILQIAETFRTDSRKAAFYGGAMLISENFSELYNDTLNAITSSGANITLASEVCDKHRKHAVAGVPDKNAFSSKSNEDETDVVIPVSGGTVENYVDERLSASIIENVIYQGSVNFIPGTPSIANDLRPFLSRYIKSAYIGAYGVTDEQFWNQAESAFGELFNAQMAAKGKIVFGSSGDYNYSQICADVLKFLNVNPKAGEEFLNRYFKDGAAARAALEKGTAESVIEFFNLRNIGGANPCPLNGYFQNKLPEITKTAKFDVKVFEVPFIVSRNDLSLILKTAGLKSGGFSFIPAAISGDVSIFERRHAEQTLSSSQDPNAAPIESLPYTKQGTWNEYKAGLVSAIFIPKVPAFPIWVKPSIIVSDTPEGTKVGGELRVSKRSPDLGLSVEPISIFGEPGKGINLDFDLLARQKGGENVMGRTSIKLESPQYMPMDFIGFSFDLGYTGQFQTKVPATNMVLFVPKFMLGPGSLSAMYGTNFSGGDFLQLDAKIKIGDAFELFGGYQTVSELANILKQENLFDGTQDIWRVGLRYNLPLK